MIDCVILVNIHTFYDFDLLINSYLYFAFAILCFRILSRVLGMVWVSRPLAAQHNNLESSAMAVVDNIGIAHSTH